MSTPANAAGQCAYSGMPISYDRFEPDDKGRIKCPMCGKWISPNWADDSLRAHKPRQL